jgi:hypothetical protein
MSFSCSVIGGRPIRDGEIGGKRRRVKGERPLVECPPCGETRELVGKSGTLVVLYLPKSVRVTCPKRSRAAGWVP